MMITKPCSQTYSEKMVHLLYIMQILKQSCIKCIKKYTLFGTCLKDLFSAVNENYNLRSQSDFRAPSINTLFLQYQFI